MKLDSFEPYDISLPEEKHTSSSYEDDDFGYSQDDLDSMYQAAYEGDPSAQWNND